MGGEPESINGRSPAPVKPAPSPPDPLVGQGWGMQEGYAYICYGQKLQVPRVFFNPCIFCRLSFLVATTMYGHHFLLSDPCIFSWVCCGRGRPECSVYFFLLCLLGASTATKMTRDHNDCCSFKATCVYGNQSISLMRQKGKQTLRIRTCCWCMSCTSSTSYEDKL